MRLFLCSNFKVLAPKFLPKFFDKNKRHNCLFVGYADDHQEFFPESHIAFLNELGFDVFCMDENYDFSDNIDMIYVKGGNTTQLLHYLRKFNQFEKIKKLVDSGVLFAGASAGAIVAGTETEWTLESEPYDYDVKSEFGEDALNGFGFIDKLIFVHASKHRFPVSDEIENAGRSDFKVSNDFFYKAYLAERKWAKGKQFMVLKDNEAFIKDGDTEKLVKINWSKYPVLDEYRLF